MICKHPFLEIFLDNTDKHTLEMNYVLKPSLEPLGTRVLIPGGASVYILQERGI